MLLKMSVQFKQANQRSVSANCNIKSNAHPFLLMWVHPHSWPRENFTMASSRLIWEWSGNEQKSSRRPKSSPAKLKWKRSGQKSHNERNVSVFLCLWFSPTAILFTTRKWWILCRSLLRFSSPNVKKASPRPAFAAAISWITAAQDQKTIQVYFCSVLRWPLVFKMYLSELGLRWRRHSPTFPWRCLVHCLQKPWIHSMPSWTWTNHVEIHKINAVFVLPWHQETLL